MDFLKNESVVVSNNNIQSDKMINSIKLSKSPTNLNNNKMLLSTST